MSSISIIGGTPLHGEVSIQGSKNAVLPILAASLLVTKGKTRIIGCPEITDVNCMINLLTELGCKISFENGVIDIDAENASYKDLTQEIVKESRSSVLMTGALIGRFHKAVIVYPGGCTIGERKINYHIDVLKSLGVDISDDSKELSCNAKVLLGNEFNFMYPSVGATENALLCGVLSKGTTILYNTAREPEISALIEFLNMSGARITDFGEGKLRIEGVDLLSGVEYKLPPDRIVGGTYLTAVAATGGNAIIHNFVKKDQECFINELIACGCKIRLYENSCRITAEKRLKAIRLVTKPYPGFPTDMQSQMMALLTLAKGQSVIEESVFEDRFRISDELIKMGACINTDYNTVQTVKITGVDKLRGSKVSAKDLRGGAALCIAGLMAEGETTVSDIHFIKRGYEDICRDLKGLGAEITYCVKSKV